MLPVLRLLIPLVLALAVAALAVRDQGQEHGEPYPPGTQRAGRVVLVIVDSLTDHLAEDPEMFPTLARLRSRALWGRMAGCLPASTVPCTRTLLEGSGAGYVAGLANFSAKRANAVSWPVIAVQQGLRIAVASDHTLVNMCEGLGGPRLHFAGAKVPVYRWDEAAVEHLAGWLRDDAADAFLIHLVDLDKVSHAAGPASEKYRQEVRDVDRALEKIVALLAPEDSLLILGDHGHDEFGSHTPNPGYLALGPRFVPGRVDLRQPTTALLLSAAAATPLPRSYEGDVPEHGLSTPFGGSAEARARIAREVEAARIARRSGGRQRVWRFLPGLALALLALVVVSVERGRRRLAAAVVLAAAAGAWLLGLAWSTHGRPLLWQGPLRNVAHHLGLVGGFAAAASLLLGRFSSLARPARLGIALLSFPLLVPLVGDDYFGSPTSLARFFVPALGLLIHVELVARSRWALAALASAIAAMVLTLGPVPNGEAWLPALMAAILGALLIARAGEPGRRVRAALLLAPVLALLGGGMDLGARATLALALLATTSACFVRAAESRVPAAIPVVGAAAILLSYWGSLRSLRFEQVRFDFVFALIPTTGSEAAVAVLGGLLTCVKYGLLPWVIVSATPALARVEHGTKMVGWLLLCALLHAAWVAGAALDPASRYHEAGIQTACLLAVLALLSVGALALQRLRAA